VSRLYTTYSPDQSNTHSDKRLKMAGSSVATHTSLGSTDPTGHPSTESSESSESSGSSGAQHFQAPRKPGFRVQRYPSALEDALRNFGSGIAERVKM
jgi:hypothetical protein